MKKLSAKLLMALLLISFTTTTISAADWGLFELKGKVKSVTYTNGVEEELFKVGFCLPAGPYVTDDDVHYIVECLKEAIR